VTDPVATPRVERLLALAAAVGAVLATAGPDLLSTAVATVGLLLVSAGLVRASRPWLSGGAVVLLGGIVVAALVGTAPLRVLGGGAATMLAWDFGERAVNLGEHFGRAGVTRRSRAVHAGGSLAVATVGVVAGYGTLVASPDSLPLVALVPLWLAVVFLVAVLGD